MDQKLESSIINFNKKTERDHSFKKINLDY